MSKLNIFDDNSYSKEYVEFLLSKLNEYNQMKTNYRCAAMNIENRFKILNEQFSSSHNYNPIETIKTRMKSEESLYRKLQLRNIPFTLEAIQENITDIAGVRVICSFEKDIYQLADILLNQDDLILVERKDYIKEPKPNGYRSLHLIIKTPIYDQNEKLMINVEVQLRTIAMDFWASLEHKLRYKKDLSEQQLAELSDGLLHCAQISSLLDLEMQNLCDRILK